MTSYHSVIGVVRDQPVHKGIVILDFTFGLYILNHKRAHDFPGHPVDVNGGRNSSESGPETLTDTRDGVVPKWTILGDQHSQIQKMDLAAIQGKLNEAQEGVHLVPWGLQTPLNAALFMNLGTRLGSLWANPSVNYALCISETQGIRLSDFNQDCSHPVWEWIVRNPQVLKDIDLERNGVGLIPTQEELSEFPEVIPESTSPGPDWLKSAICSQPPRKLTPGYRSDADAVAVKAGYCQWHGWFEESHQLSQSIEGLGTHRSGDYWHAIHHRREADFSNSKYWFRQVGRHPLFPLLADFCRKLFETVPHRMEGLQTLVRNHEWDPFAFVDVCEMVAKGKNSDWGYLARTIQAFEMTQLIQATYQDAMAI